MNKTMLFSLLILTSLSTFAGADGDKVGNGGGGHVCPGKVELYDFYEGRHPDLYNFRLLVLDPSLTTADYIELGLSRLGQNYPGLVDGTRNIINQIQSIPYDRLVRPIKIPRIPDADIPFVDEDCEYEQIANWNERFDSVFFRKKLFEAMDPMNQAGLFLHEAFYKAGRDLNKLQNSNTVRKLVAKTYSQEVIESSDVRNVFGSDVLTAPKSGKCSLKFQFSSLPENTCNLRDKKIELSLGDKNLNSSDSEMILNCEDLHSSQTMELNYHAYAGSICNISVNINGETYLMKDREFSYKKYIQFKSF